MLDAHVTCKGGYVIILSGAIIPLRSHFKRARRALSLDATYKSEGSRDALTKDNKFGYEFDRQIASVKAMAVRFIEVPNPLAQYLLELYAHMEWNLPLDEFDTH